MATLATPSRRSRRLSGLEAELGPDVLDSAIKLTSSKRPRSQLQREDEEPYHLRSSKKNYKLNAKLLKNGSAPVNSKQVNTVTPKKKLKLSPPVVETQQKDQDAQSRSYLFLVFRLMIFAALVAALSLGLEFYLSKASSEEQLYSPIEFDIQLSLTLINTVLEKTASINNNLQLALNSTDFPRRIEAITENFKY